MCAKKANSATSINGRTQTFAPKAGLDLTKITVTQPSLPALEEFIPYLKEIWQSKNLTNGGPFHKKFEAELADFLGVPYISLFTNATIALLTALQALRITGEVITTPYSFVATSHSLLWNGIKPVFVDIEPDSFNISPEAIEAAITPHTTAIMPVHCYGNPCELDKIQQIAENYNLKVIYDAAHAFGVRQKGESILNAGDLSILSFHATKVFNTFEGGAIISHDLRTKQHIDHLKNFGFVDEVTVVASGINGKMSEFNAALGLLQLKHIREELNKRRIVDTQYRQGLSDLNGIHLSTPAENCETNWSYFPMRVTEKFPISRDELYNHLKSKGILARRYFYPLISEFPMYRHLPSSHASNLPNAVKASREIICLPQHAGLEMHDVRYIISCIQEASETKIHIPLAA
jgi:dTDP-4-amino-4,6-dideoxygalactose transaminase